MKVLKGLKERETERNGGGREKGEGRKEREGRTEREEEEEGVRFDYL